MKPELQIKALAKLDGWTFEYGFFCHRHKTTNELLCSDMHGSQQHVSDYLTSYDAIIPLIQKQSDKIKTAVFELLQDSKETISVIAVWDATPAQLCKALLRATGEWKE